MTRTYQLVAFVTSFPTKPPPVWGTTLKQSIFPTSLPTRAPCVQTSSTPRMPFTITRPSVNFKEKTRSNININCTDSHTIPTLSYLLNYFCFFRKHQGPNRLAEILNQKQWKHPNVWIMLQVLQQNNNMCEKPHWSNSFPQPFCVFLSSLQQGIQFKEVSLQPQRKMYLNHNFNFVCATFSMNWQ